MEDYPKKLVEYIQERELDGDDIMITQGSDSTFIIFVPRELEKFIVVCEWYEGSDDFSMVNIAGKAFDRVHQFMRESAKEPA